MLSVKSDLQEKSATVGVLTNDIERLAKTGMATVVNRGVSLIAGFLRGRFRATLYLPRGGNGL